MPLRPDLKPREFLEIILRRKWLIVFSALFILFGASAYSVITPEMYKSSTTILVVPQGVPEDYVRSTVSANINDRLFTIRQQVMSRTRLIAVMDELGLFKEARRKKPIEDVVELMRKRIDIEVASSTARRRSGSGDDAFTLAFVYETPQQAMLTTSRLASYFIDENVKNREQQAVGTSEFLESQLKGTKGRLEAQEERVKQYKLKYMGELPQQMQANLQILSRLQDQLRANAEALRSAKDRKVFVEAQIGALEAQLSVISSQMGTAEKASSESGSKDVSYSYPDPMVSISRDLTEKKVQLAALSAKYTDQYPEIRRLKEEIKQLEKRLDTAIQNAKALGSDNSRSGNVIPPIVMGSAASPGERERDEIRRLRAQSKALDSEIDSIKKDRVGLQKESAILEGRVEQSPRREQEMVALTRDYENLKASYDDLLKKKLNADVSQNLEKRQKGEQFQILDPADLPQEPFSPNRPKLFGIALAVALLVGFGGAFGIEVINPTLRGKRDFQHYFKVPVLASIPVIRDTEYEGRKSNRLTVVYSGLVSFGALLTIFLAVFGHKIRTFLQGMFS